MVIYLESNLHIDRDVSAIIHGINLIIEASRSMEYGKPVRTHLLGKELLSDSETGGFEIGFTEVNLDKGFRYTVLSCGIVHPGLLKVTLSIRQIKSNSKENVN